MKSQNKQPDLLQYNNRSHALWTADPRLRFSFPPGRSCSLKTFNARCFLHASLSRACWLNMLSPHDYNTNVHLHLNQGLALSLPFRPLAPNHSINCRFNMNPQCSTGGHCTIWWRTRLLVAFCRRCANPAVAAAGSSSGQTSSSTRNSLQLALAARLLRKVSVGQFLCQFFLFYK